MINGISEFITIEFGNVLLLDSSESLAFPITFNSKETALDYSYDKQKTYSGRSIL